MNQNTSMTPQTDQTHEHNVDRSTCWPCTSDTEHGSNAEQLSPSLSLQTYTEEIYPVTGEKNHVMRKLYLKMMKNEQY